MEVIAGSVLYWKQGMEEQLRACGREPAPEGNQAEVLGRFGVGG
jgi:hypothetical protein